MTSVGLKLSLRAERVGCSATDRPRTSTDTMRVCADSPTLLFARHRYVPASNLRTELILSDPVLAHPVTDQCTESHCKRSSVETEIDELTDSEIG